MLYHIEHKTFTDNRGSYTPIALNTLNKKWNQCCISVNDNQFTFRGLHYQENPRQTKYIKVIKGSIIDYALDLETGHLDSITLTQSDAVLIPNTKAHGFLTLEKDTIVAYLVEGEWSPETERSIVWSNIPVLKEMIESVVGESLITISDKDSNGK